MPKKGQITPIKWVVRYRLGVFYDVKEVKKFFPTSYIPAFFKYNVLQDKFKCIKAVRIWPIYNYKPFKHERTDNKA